LPFFIKFYRSRFKDCKIVVYDNESTDNTVSIAKKNKCKVNTYSTNGMIDFFSGHKIKNNCWKKSDTEWVLICDADEMLDINQGQLQKENESGITIISTEAYHMVNMEDNLSLENICYGYRDAFYDKSLLFNKGKISEINYEFGCHHNTPKGNAIYSNKYRMYHYLYLSSDYIVSGYKSAASRLNEESIIKHWGGQYVHNNDDMIRELFKEIRTSSIKLF
jgi:glycosyltransferase involved in cell wall biosynthesis